MTRDEAIRKILPIVGHTSAFCEAWIDAYVALGKLKLDEPMSAEALLFEKLGWPKFGAKQTEVHNALCEAGLRIVEK